MILAPEAANSREDKGIYWDVKIEFLRSRVRRLEGENAGLRNRLDVANKIIADQVRDAADLVAKLTHGAGVEEHRLAELAAKVSS